MQNQDPSVVRLPASVRPVSKLNAPVLFPGLFATPFEPSAEEQAAMRQLAWHRYGGLRQRYRDSRTALRVFIDPIRMTLVFTVTPAERSLYLMHFLDPKLRLMTVRACPPTLHHFGSRLRATFPLATMDAEGSTAVHVVPNEKQLSGGAFESSAQAKVAKILGWKLIVWPRSQLLRRSPLITRMAQVRQCLALHLSERPVEAARWLHDQLVRRPLESIFAIADECAIRFSIARQLAHAVLYRLHAAGLIRIDFERGDNALPH